MINDWPKIRINNGFAMSLMIPHNFRIVNLFEVKYAHSNTGIYAHYMHTQIPVSIKIQIELGLFIGYGVLNPYING